MTNINECALRPTWAEINLSQLAKNIRALRARAPKARYCFPVKADAYGHGLIEVAKTAEAEQVDCLGVAFSDEGVLLREAGITTPILILGASFPEQAPVILQYNLTATAFDEQMIAALDAEARKRMIPARIHVKIDTGMGRVGVREDDALAFFERISGYTNVVVEGVFTHFPVADEDIPYTKAQYARFIGIVDALRNINNFSGIAHAANSAALIRLPETALDMTRPGIATYGYWMNEEEKREIGVKPILTLKSKIAFVKRVRKGESVSYGRTYRAKRDARIATVPIGYGDGIFRSLSNNMEALVEGKRVPLVGRVTMDQTMFDVSAVEGARAGMDIALIDEINSVEALAARAQTIPYEITCALSRRIRRVFLRD